jgi:hypothetical protein
MPKLRFILLSVSVLALSGLTSGTILPSHAAAQSSSDTYMLEIQDMISWMKGAAEVTVAMTEVFNSQQMNDLMFSLSADTLDVNKLEKQFGVLYCRGRTTVCGSPRTRKMGYWWVVNEQL